MFLDDSAFRTAIASTPLVSIDLVIQNTRDEVLLGQRVNRPAQGFWFVPGGRVLKKETLDRAFARLTTAELGVRIERQEADLLGVYEHFYDDSVFGSTPSTHYIVLAHLIRADFDLSQLPVAQHARFGWFAIRDAKNNEQIHKHSRAYLSAL